MRYLMLHRIDESATFHPADDPGIPGSAAAQAMDAWVAEMEGTGVKQYGGRLRPVAEAVTVRVRDGQATITDGPFAETKEALAGYYILECADLDEAIGWARRIPTMCKGGEGSIEIRPILDIPKPL